MRKKRTIKHPKEEEAATPTVEGEDDVARSPLQKDRSIIEAGPCLRCGKPSYTYWNSNMGMYTAYCSDVESCKLVQGPWTTREEAREHWKRVRPVKEAV